MSRYEVLLVDDEPRILKTAGGVLEDKGYRVTKASSGEAAVEALNGKDFDLVITDLNMYEIDGFTVLKMAKVQNPETMVILFTGSDHVTSPYVLRLGFDDYITKPCGLDELLKRVTDCFQRFEQKPGVRDNEGARINSASPSPGRRSHPRYPLNKITSYSYGGKRFLTLTLDLGLGGMRIRTHYDLPNDQRLDFKLILEDDPIWPKGRIAYTGFLPREETIAGIQFTDLSDQDGFLLQNYLGTLGERPKTQDMFFTGEKTGTPGDRSKNIQDDWQQNGEGRRQRNHL